MANYYYIARPARWAGIKNVGRTVDNSSEWEAKARALQVRRWRALRRASKSAPLNEVSI